MSSSSPYRFEPAQYPHLGLDADKWTFHQPAPLIESAETAPGSPRSKKSPVAAQPEDFHFVNDLDHFAKEVEMNHSFTPESPKFAFKNDMDNSPTDPQVKSSAWVRRPKSSVSTERSLNPKKEPYRSFQVFKSNPFGFGAPSVSILIHPTGGTAQTPSPPYHTSRLTALKQRPWLPPSFKIFPGGSTDRLHEEEAAVPEETVAKVHYRGLEGLVTLKVEVDMCKPGGIQFTHRINEGTGKKGMVIKREGLGRQYSVQLKGYPDGQTQAFVWKGSKSAVGLIEDGSPMCNGNLKLISPLRPEEVLAIWKNRTDPAILGNLLLFKEFDEGENGQLEEVIVSCLAVVCAERMSGRGWLGGLGKKAKPEYDARRRGVGDAWRQSLPIRNNDTLDTLT